MRLAYSPFLAHVRYRGLSATLRKVRALCEKSSVHVTQFPSIARAHVTWSLERAQQRTERCARGCFLTLPQPLTHRSRARGAVNLQLCPSTRAIRTRWRSLILALTPLGASVARTERRHRVTLDARALRRAPGRSLSHTRARARGACAYSAVSSSMGGHACLHTELIHPKTGQHVATSRSNVCTFYPMYVPIILAINQGNQRGRQTQTAARPIGDVTHVHARWMGHARPRMGYHYICQQFSCDMRTSRTARARTLDAS